MQKRSLKYLLNFVVNAGWVSSAFAQAASSTINPGLISRENRLNEQQIQRQNEAPSIGPAVVGPSVPQTIIGASGGTTFLLRAVIFEKSVFISQEQLDSIARPYVGTKVDLAQVQRIVKAVNDIYADRGLITASAYLPTQDLSSGTLRVGIVEGRLGQLSIEGAKRLNDYFIRSQVPVKPGDVVDASSLTQSISGFNKTGVAQFQAALKPGASFGLTDINLAVVEPPAVTLNVFTDNQGVPSVNRYEGGFLLQGYAPLSIDDRLTLYGVKSEGNIDGNVAYNLPFNNAGGRVGVSYTQGAIRIVQGPFAIFDVRGRSQVESLNVAQPIYIDANWFSIANGALSRNVSSSTQNAVDITDNLTTKKTVGFSVGYANEMGSISVSPTYSDAETDFRVTGANQKFNLYNATFNGFLRLPSSFLLTAAGALQYSSTPQIAGDQLFQLGGPTTVRGYTTGIVAAGRGFFSSFELHRPLTSVLPGLDVFSFYDTGAISSTSPTYVALNSAGVGVSYDFNKRILAEFSVARPLTTVRSDQAPYQLYFRLTSKFSSADLERAN